jgi:formamidopyrimidine-DNA glycosylase
MPELPEVETTKRGIAPHLERQTVAKVVVRNNRLRQLIPDDIHQRCAGREVKSISRRAKYLFIQLDDGELLIHLGMSGTLRIVDHQLPAEKHDHVDLVLENGKCLRFNDPRRFGLYLWHDGAQPHPLTTKLGPEPLTADFDGKRLHDLAKNRKIAVKPYIMSNNVVVGVGNIYASEALFRAGIDPRKAAGKISRARYNKLAQVIKEVLEAAIEAGGTTLKDFSNADGKPGYFAQELNVYGREGKPCKVCERPIKQQVLGQRASFYCASCQR